jgi:hypothetical protein
MAVKDIGKCPEIDKKATRVTVSTRLGEMTTVTITTVSARRIILKPALSIYARVIPLLKKAQIKTKILIAFCQIAINTGYNCKVEFPKTFTAVLNAIKFVNLDLVPSLGLQCKLKFDYCGELVVVCLSPIIVLFLLLVLYFKQTRFDVDDDELILTNDIYYASDELQIVFGKKLNKYRQFFKHIDSDLSGELDEKEVKEMFAEMDLDATENELDEYVSAFFVDVDLHDSGKINFSEFLSGIRVALEQPQKCKFASIAAKIDAKAMQTRGQLVFYLILLLSFLVLVLTSTTIFHYFSCDYFPLPEGGERAFLFVDYTIGFVVTFFVILET